MFMEWISNILFIEYCIVHAVYWIHYEKQICIITEKVVSYMYIIH